MLFYQPITLITASMEVHPFFHQEEGCNDDDHAGAFVFEHINGRHDGEDEDGLVLLPITLITASMRFHPFHREKRRRISGYQDILIFVLIVVTVVVNIIIIPILMMAWQRLSDRQTVRGSAGYLFCAFLLSFSDDILIVVTVVVNIIIVPIRMMSSPSEKQGEDKPDIGHSSVFSTFLL